MVCTHHDASLIDPQLQAVRSLTCCTEQGHRCLLVAQNHTRRIRHGQSSTHLFNSVGCSLSIMTISGAAMYTRSHRDNRAFLQGLFELLSSVRRQWLLPSCAIASTSNRSASTRPHFRTWRANRHSWNRETSECGAFLKKALNPRKQSTCPSITYPPTTAV